MYSVIYAPEAEAQLVALFFHIAAVASPEIAARYTDAIVEQCESLKTFPMRVRGGMISAPVCVSSASGGASASPSKLPAKS